MAGTGPAPKDPGESRRRNKPPEFEPLPAAGYAGDYPPLPATWSTTQAKTIKNGDGENEVVTETVKFTFLKATRDWYETWATSPMATEFTGVDWQRLQRIAKLVDQYERHPTKDLIAELRLQEAGFGGTPLDRRRLGRTIGKAGGGATAPASGSKRSAARKRRLHRVK